MGDHDMIPSCLSAEEHEPRDFLYHYLGCREFHEREEYFDTLEEGQQRQIDSELRRIKYLRTTLGRDPEDKQFVDYLTTSIANWRAWDGYNKGLGEVQQWRQGKRLPNHREQRDPAESKKESPEGPRQTDYNPDVDHNAYHIEYLNGEPVNLEEGDDRYTGRYPNHKIPVSKLLTKEDEKGRPSPLLKIKDPKGDPKGDAKEDPKEDAKDDPKEDAKEDPEEKVKKKPKENRVRYFHLPANNMIWAEKAVARYFGEDDLAYDDIWRDPTEGTQSRTRTSMLLRAQFWKGQQHGGRSALVHARHLRPMSETVSSDPEHVEANPRNIVLFAPYMHWETDRRREMISQLIDTNTETHRKKRHETEKKQRRKRQKYREDLIIPVANHPGKDMWSDDEDNKLPPNAPPARTPSSAFRGALHLHRKFNKILSSKIFAQQNGRIIASHLLGQVLFDAAMLYEAMTSYRDKKLIHVYLHKDPPLHPRRTLDQAYYWTLKTTQARDRDQVVYRGTRTDPNHEHHIDPETKTWTCHWPHDTHCHGKKGGKKDTKIDPKKRTKYCTLCRDQIRKVSRVVMVDQLWMWILDERTIITCFPRRYGVNKQDASGVHKSIRARLKNMRKDHIKTVFDLALIILEEVTNTFFDRAKTQDRQPQVIDIFAEAIGRVTNKQTIAFEHLWIWTKKLANLSSSKAAPDLSGFVVPLLNINPEGVLQREIKDIIDELDIMIHINKQQKEVIKKFKKDVEHLLDPSGTWWEKSAVIAPKNESDDEKASREKYLWFKSSAEELLSDVHDHVEELEGLKLSAKSTSESLDHLLGLKQQQASVVQAWQSVEQAEESVKQGRTLMIFTIITIIFLPLAFMSSVFGMNNQELSNDNTTWTLNGQFRLMFPISFGIVLATFIFAYSSLVRTIFWDLGDYLVTWLLVTGGIYRKYLTFESTRETAIKKAQKKVRELKEQVRQTRLRKVREKILVASEKAEESYMTNLIESVTAVVTNPGSVPTNQPNGTAATQQQKPGLLERLGLARRKKTRENGPPV